VDTGPAAQLIPQRAKPGEDYLNLNVWTPELAGSLPVMVFFHGGSFTSGSGAVGYYDGAALASGGAVVVTLNYRLGLDGFPPFREVANLGLRDMVAALEWVRANIAAFGGDPARVTVFGQSAGGNAIYALMVMPAARGLFQRAIVQSGTPCCVLTADSAAAVRALLAAELGTEPTLEAFAAAPISDLVMAQALMGAAVLQDPDPEKWRDVALNYLPFAPMIDGDTVPMVPLDAIRAGAGAEIELLTGYNADEFRLFTVPTGMADAVDQAAVERYAAMRGLSADGVARYLRSRSLGDAWNAIISDWMYAVPTIRVAEAREANSARTHLYEFAWPSPACDGRVGACHGLELPFVFGTLDDPEAKVLVGEDLPAALSAEVRAVWTGFASGAGAAWPAYTTASRTLRRFGQESATVSDPRPDEFALWADIR
jgi:para-nitrobenzyl esterase